MVLQDPHVVLQNSHVVLQNPHVVLRVNFWCVLCIEGITGPYSFKNGATITINGDIYHMMVTDFFVPALRNIEMNIVWFHQDDATCYTTHATIHLLHQTFDGHLIN